MAYYFLLFVSFFLFASILKVFRQTFYSLAQNSVNLIDKLLAETEEDEKIEELSAGNKKLVLSVCKMLGVFIIAVIIGSIPIFSFLFFSDNSLTNLDFSSFKAILSLSVGASIPFIIPTKIKNPSQYSELSQLLHRLALDNYNVSSKLLKLESKKIEKEKLDLREDFIIVSGLARAGTTSLLNELAHSKDFVSLNYANMPFLLGPNFWAKIYKPKSVQKKERSHKDGIMIGMNSNEALEEYFFKVKANDKYIEGNFLKEYTISENDYQDYLVYQTIIKRNNQKIYLAKNNNFILRYKSIRSINKDFLMVILFREPLTHAASLLEKHKSYKKLQQEDPFILEYMNWLGHHEFGLNQKEFSIDQSQTMVSGDKDKLDYWLKIWLNYYSYVSQINDANTLFISYEDYCNDPELIISEIRNKAHMKSVPISSKPFINKRTSNLEYSEALYNETHQIYELLRKKCIS